MADSDIAWDYPLANSIEGQLLEAVRDRIKELALTSIPGERVVIQKLPWIIDESQLPLPCVIVSPAAETTDALSGTNERDEVNFGIFVTCVLANARDVTAKGLGLQCAWRQTLRESFQNLNASRFTQLAGLDGGYFVNGTVESGDKFIEAAKRMQRDAQYFLLRLKVREIRN